MFFKKKKDNKKILNITPTMVEYGHIQNLITEFDRVNVEYINIEYGAMFIDQHVFSNMQKLISVVMTDSVRQIDAGAFSNCPNLVNIELSPILTELSAELFKDCISLETINIPDSVKKIGLECFSGCKSLKSITLPSNLKFIGLNAFCDCISLEEVILPSSFKENIDNYFTNYKDIIDNDNLIKVLF